MACGRRWERQILLESHEAASIAEGNLLSHERFAGIPNDGSPASQEMVQKLLGWR
jgi:hypothetical protein